MKRKGMVALFALMLSGVLIAGCGSKDSETKENTDQTETSAQEEASEDQVQEEAEETATEETEKKDIYVFIAASLKNTMEEIKTEYEKAQPDVNIIYNADSSGTLQTQIEEGAQCDIFFSASTKQMDALTEGGFVVEGSVSNLLENKIVLIKPAGEETAVTGFENITEASSLALAG